MILTNATLVLPDEVVHGTVMVEDGLIREVQPGAARLPGALDCEGDVLMPGVVDLHTDNLERQVQPRANARWPSRSAFLAHDGQCAAAGGLPAARHPRSDRRGQASADALSARRDQGAERRIPRRQAVPGTDQRGAASIHR